MQNVPKTISVRPSKPSRKILQEFIDSNTELQRGALSAFVNRCILEEGPRIVSGRIKIAMNCRKQSH